MRSSSALPRQHDAPTGVTSLPKPSRHTHTTTRERGFPQHSCGTKTSPLTIPPQTTPPPHTHVYLSCVALDTLSLVDVRLTTTNNNSTSSSSESDTNTALPHLCPKLMRTCRVSCVAQNSWDPLSAPDSRFRKWVTRAVSRELLLLGCPHRSLADRSMRRSRTLPARAHISPSSHART